MTFQPCRRQVLGLGAGLAAGAVLASCAGDSANQIDTGTVLARTEEVPAGQVKPVLVGEIPIMIAHTPDGQFTAFSAICPHQGCKVVPVADGPEILECPCHRSRFDSYTGDVLNGPALEALSEFPIEVRDGNITAA